MSSKVNDVEMDLGNTVIMKVILGIETSCDETAAAVICDDEIPERRILSNIVHSQLQHQEYGGVVPEIASRAHIVHIDNVIKSAMYEANIEFDNIDGIAVTSGPGLIGGVLVGVMIAKSIAYAANKPLIGVNHLEGHALTVRMTDDAKFPFLLLLISGGHCQILSVENVGKYQQYGKTRDDALGEAFDKVAKMLDLGYPGGPAVEKMAAEGDESRFKLPMPLYKEKTCDFSFSGLKTAVLRYVEDMINESPSEEIKNQFKRDLCASFQKTCGDVLVDRLSRAIIQFKVAYNTIDHKPQIVVAGGVAANKYIRSRLSNLAEENDMELICPPIYLCTDNAAMIGWTGLERLKLGLISDLKLTPRARWPLSKL